MKTFELYVPAGWVRLDLSGDVAAAVTRTAERITSSVPAERRALAKTFLREKLTAVAENLSSGGAVCILLPIESVTDMPIRPLIVAVPLDVPAGTAPMDLLVAVASSDPTAEVIDVDGLVLLRTHSAADLSDQYQAAVREAISGFGTDVSAGADATPIETLEQARSTATRVRYLIGDPADPERWVDLYFTVEHPAHPGLQEVVDAAVALFDTQVRTFRWTA